MGAKQISDLLGLTGYRVIGSRSNYIILHKRMGKLLPMPVYPVPSNTYMGIHITPTVDGNVTVGPDAENTDVLDDYSVPQANMDSLAVEGAKLWPHIFKKDQIRTFAGIQPKWVDENGAIQDWKVEIRDDVAPNAVNLVVLPAAGYRNNDGFKYLGSSVGYWSSSLKSGHPGYAGCMGFYSNSVGSGYNYRCFGLSVRPVLE